MPPSTCQPTDLSAVCERLDTLITLLTRVAESAAAPPVSPYVNKVELGQMLGIDPRSVMRMAATGALPKPSRVGNRPRWLRTDIDEFLKRKRK